MIKKLRFALCAVMAMAVATGNSWSAEARIETNPPYIANFVVSLTRTLLNGATEAFGIVQPDGSGGLVCRGMLINNGQLVGEPDINRLNQALQIAFGSRSQEVKAEVVRRMRDNEGLYACRIWTTNELIEGERAAENTPIVIAAAANAEDLDELVVVVKCIPEGTGSLDSTPAQVQAKIAYLGTEAGRLQNEIQRITSSMNRYRQMVAEPVQGQANPPVEVFAVGTGIENIGAQQIAKSIEDLERISGKFAQIASTAAFGIIFRPDSGGLKWRGVSLVNGRWVRRRDTSTDAWNQSSQIAFGLQKAGIELIRRNEGQGRNYYAWITHDKPIVVLLAKQNAGPLDRLIVDLKCMSQRDPTPEQVQAKIVYLDAELVRLEDEVQIITSEMEHFRTELRQVMRQAERTRHATSNMSTTTAAQ